MQLKHLPFCFLIVAGICLAGALTASAETGESPATEVPSGR
jgi:hypothetical protein